MQWTYPQWYLGNIIRQRRRLLYGQFHGYGRYKSSNGDWYEGFYYHNLRHGRGTLFRASRQRFYEGNFVNGAEHGYGVITRVR
jgi:hypothetical protein